MIQRSVDCTFDEHYKAKADIRIADGDGYGIIFKNCKHLIFRDTKVLRCIFNEFSEVKKAYIRTSGGYRYDIYKYFKIFTT